MSMQEMANAMVSWYHGIHAFYQHHHHQMLVAAAAAGTSGLHDQPPRSKRRKVDRSSKDGGASGSDHHVSSSSTTTRLLRSRGHVTFKPYSDDLEKKCRDEEYVRRRGQNQPLKRKLGEEASRRAAVEAWDEGGEEEGETRGKRTRGVKEKAREAEAQMKTTVGNLFPEILSNIFQYLDVQSKGRAARVCRSWKDAAYRKYIWSDVEAKLHLGRSNPYLYPSLVKRGIKRVQVLSLRRSLRELVNGVPGLEELNLSGCYNLTDSALDSAFYKDVPALKHLNLSLCKDVSDNSLGRIATHCKNLERLDLGGCTKVTNMGLFFISLGLKKIKRLNLRSCRQVSDIGIGHLGGVNTQSAPGQGLKELLEISLQDCQKLTDESLRHISVGIPSIKKINLSFCVSVTDTGLKSLARLPSLEELNLRSCDNVSDIGVGFLAEEGGARDLRVLDVSFCANVTDTSLKLIAGGMPRIRTLSMTTCAISDDGLKRASQSLRDLEDLNIGQCLAVTDAGLLALVEKLGSLRSLDVYGCPKVTRTAVLKVGAMPNMKNINREL